MKSVRLYSTGDYNLTLNTEADTSVASLDDLIAAELYWDDFEEIELSDESKEDGFIRYFAGDDEKGLLRSSQHLFSQSKTDQHS